MRNEPGCPVAKGRNATLHRPYGPSSARRDDGPAASPRTLAQRRRPGKTRPRCRRRAVTRRATTRLRTTAPPPPMRPRTTRPTHCPCTPPLRPRTRRGRCSLTTTTTTTTRRHRRQARRGASSARRRTTSSSSSGQKICSARSSTLGVARVARGTCGKQSVCRVLEIQHERAVKF